MYGLFNGLEIGKRALVSSQLAMTTIGHNMANVNTPGFSRQRVMISSAEPVDTAWGNTGNGVKINGVEHIRDLFLTGQYRQENASLGNWEFMQKSVSQIEGFFNEPQDNSLGDVLDGFWKAWNTLAGSADDTQARSALVQQTTVLTNSFHQIDKQFRELRQNIDNSIGDRVLQLNQLGKQIANLNLQIQYQELGSQKANDLRDQRDVLIDDLSQYADVTVLERDNGTTAVMIGAMAFVDGSEFLRIGTKTDYNGDNGTTTRIVWADSDTEIKFSNGEIKGMLETRDVLIPNHLKSLDQLAKGIVENVNALHQQGYGLDGNTERDYFDPEFTTAAHIAINVEIKNNSDLIAAGDVPDAPANGLIAESISNLLSNGRVMNGGSTTIGEFYGGIVGQLGITSMEAESYKDNYGLLVQQIENQRQSVQGVSLDEEMTSLVKFQNAYEAAARVITAMDQALETLINNTGIVGR